MFGRFEISGGEVCPCQSRRQGWPLFGDFGRDGTRPLEPLTRTPIAIHFVPRCFDNRRDEVLVAAGVCVGDRQFEVSTFEMPGGGTVMEGGEFGGKVLGGPHAEDFAEQLVIAEPLATGIERDEEEVRPLQSVKDVGAIVTVEYGIAKRCGKAVEDGCPEKEAAGFVCLQSEDFIEEVIEDETMAARELAHERRGIGTAGK